MRSLLPIAALLLAPLAALPASAQLVSIYGTYNPTRTSNVQSGLLTTSAGFQEEYTTYWSRGFGGGVTFGLIPLGPIHIGFDVRASTKPGNNGADLALAGLRVGLKLPILTLKPYVQGSVGYLGTRTPNLSNVGGGGTYTTSYVAYEILGGIDMPIIHFVDFRLVEIGGGQGINYFGPTGSQNATLLTISTGLVVHF